MEPSRPASEAVANPSTRATPPPRGGLAQDAAPRALPVELHGTGRGVRQFSKYLGETTNNVAEYLALIYAMQEALRYGYTALAVKTDSELLARQLNGQYRVKNAQLRLFHDLAMHLAQGFRRFSIEHIPRDQNTLADRLAGRAVKQRFQ